MTVNGTGFVASSVVRWNGADRVTTFVSSTQLRAAISAPDLATPGTAQSYILTVLQAKGSADPSLSPSLVDNGTSWTVTLAPSNSITFQKGMTSSGGSITVDGVTTPFRNNVQAMTVSAAGPVWEP